MTVKLLEEEIDDDDDDGGGGGVQIEKGKGDFLIFPTTSLVTLTTAPLSLLRRTTSTFFFLRPTNGLYINMINSFSAPINIFTGYTVKWMRRDPQHGGVGGGREEEGRVRGSSQQHHLKSWEKLRNNRTGERGFVQYVISETVSMVSDSHCRPLCSWHVLYSKVCVCVWGGWGVGGKVSLKTAS